MTTTQKSLLRAFCLAALATAAPVAALAQQPRSAAPEDPRGAPVTVINTNANPVPVTGSTTVTGTVTLAGGTVQVGNPASSPVPVKVVATVAPQPVHKTITVLDIIHPPGHLVGVYDVYTVPGDKRLVIEDASVALFSPASSSEAVVVALRTTLGAGTADHYVPTLQSGTSPAYLVRVGGRSLRAYGSPGSLVKAIVDWPGGVAPEIRITISGYLEPI